MRMLRFKITDDKHWTSIKTILLYLGYITEDWMPEIHIDEKLADRLRDL